MEREQQADDEVVDERSSGYEPPLVEDLESESEGATVTVTGGIVVSRALAEPTDNPPVPDGG